MRRLALLLLVGLLAACGGGNDGNDDSAELTRAEYTRLANASCVKAEKTLDELGAFDNFQELSKEMEVGRKAVQQSADELKAMKPPARLAAQHRELVSLTEETADVAARISAAADENDQVEMQKQAERAEDITRASNEVARKLGLEECVAG
jgi:hypothetical protein